MQEKDLTSIISELEHDSIGLALHKMRTMRLSAGLTDRLRDTEMMYRQLLRFFTSNAPDPTRAENYYSVKRQLLEIADEALRDMRAGANPSLYYSQFRNSRLPGAPTPVEMIEQTQKLCSQLSLADLADTYPHDLHRHLEQTLDRIFNALWTNLHLSEVEAERISDFMLGVTADDDASMQAAGIILSALLFSSLEFYDRRKLAVMMRVYARSSVPGVAARALVGAALTILRYPLRLRGDETLRRLSDEAAERPEYLREMKALALNMLRTRNTDRVNRHMNEEIIPNLMKLRPEIERRLKSIDPSDFSSIEDSPKWMEMLEESGAGDKLREFAEMQSEGADVFMSSFSRLKGFSFFRSMSNWLLPFSSNHSELHDIMQRMPGSFAEMLSASPVFCNSDRYSFMLSLARSPMGKLAPMGQMLSDQLEQMSRQQMASLSSQLESTVALETDVYLRDLYRFFRLFDRRSEFYDPFGQSFFIPDAPLFHLIHDDVDTLQGMADFNLKNHYYGESATILGHIVEISEPDSSVLEKLAYSIEKQGDIREALKIYRRAELMSEPSKWLLSKLAFCLRITGDFAAAASYYSRALETDPDNLKLELLRAHSLLEAGDAKAALKGYYKVDYLDPTSRKAARGIAWCEFLLQHYDKSAMRYKQIIEEEDAIPSDMLNYGHALAAQGKIDLAVATYRDMVAATDTETFIKQIEQDADTLQAAGISALTRSLIIDAVVLS